jgi:hypothetical protein
VEVPQPDGLVRFRIEDFVSYLAISDYYEEEDVDRVYVIKYNGKQKEIPIRNMESEEFYSYIEKAMRKSLLMILMN